MGLCMRPDIKQHFGKCCFRHNKLDVWILVSSFIKCEPPQKLYNNIWTWYNWVLDFSTNTDNLHMEIFWFLTFPLFLSVCIYFLSLYLCNLPSKWCCDMEYCKLEAWRLPSWILSQYQLEWKLCVINFMIYYHFKESSELSCESWTGFR